MRLAWCGFLIVFFVQSECAFGKAQTIVVSTESDSMVTTIRYNCVFLELGGNCIYPFQTFRYPWLHFSVNYERLFLLQEKWTISTRIGTNLPFGNQTVYRTSHAMLVMVAAIYGKRKSKFELGVGMNAGARYLDYSDLRFSFAMAVGLRFVGEKNRLPFRIVYTPLLGISNGKLATIPFFGISLGYAF